MLTTGLSEFVPGHLYEWADYFCKEVARNCDVTADLAFLMATYRDIAKFGDTKVTKVISMEQWQEELGQRFFLITCYLHDRAAKGRSKQGRQ